MQFRQAKLSEYKELLGSVFLEQRFFVLCGKLVWWTSRPGHLDPAKLSNISVYIYICKCWAALETCSESFFLVRLLKVLDILQHIQALDPSQHGAVGYLVQHTLEHIERRKEEVGPEVKHRSDEKHKEVCFSIGLIMKHKR